MHFHIWKGLDFILSLDGEKHCNQTFYVKCVILVLDAACLEVPQDGTITCLLHPVNRSDKSGKTCSVPENSV